MEPSSDQGYTSYHGAMLNSLPIESMVMGSPCKVLFSVCPWKMFNICSIRKIFDFPQDSAEKHEEGFFSLFTLRLNQSSVFEQGHLDDI